MPGGWPVREQEVEELTKILADLRSRFQPIHIGTDTNLTPYGMGAESRPLTVMVTADGKTFKLTFGEPKADPSESPFIRPAFLRVNDFPEILRLGPDVFTALRRPLESYRRRQLFPNSQRIKIASTSPPAGGFPSSGMTIATESLPAADIREIIVKGPNSTFSAFGATFATGDGAFALKRMGALPAPAVLEKGADPAISVDRIAEAWEISSPARDRAEPSKLEKALAVLPELWVEEFVSDPAFAAKVGLNPPERSFVVKRDNRDPIEIQFGAVARTTEREEPAPPPQFGAPPMPPRKVKEDYRYARFANNSQVFVVKADRLADLFVKRDEIADPQPARFGLEEVRELIVQAPGKESVRLTRKKGNPKADSPADRADRWYVAAPGKLLAESSKVEALINRLCDLRAASPAARVAKPSPTAYNFDSAVAIRVNVTARERRPDAAPEAPERHYTLRIGAADPITKQIPVRLDGWDRVTLIEDDPSALLPPPSPLQPQQPPPSATASLITLLGQPPSAYRGRRLFDTGDMKLDEIALEAPADTFTLTRDVIGSSTKWKFTKPDIGLADDAKASKLAGLVSGLEAAEYLAASPTPDELTKFGLDKPSMTLNLSFTGPGGGAHRLLIGTSRPGKPEVYARLDGGNVFALSDALPIELKGGALSLLTLRMWQVSPDKIIGLELTRAEGMGVETFTLTRKEDNFELTGPFAVTIPAARLAPLLAALGNVEATRFQVLQAKSPAEFGFDKPTARVKITWKDKPTDSPTTKTLIVGNPADGTGRYAQLEGNNQSVFVIPAAVSMVASISPLAVVDPKVLQLRSGLISRIQIARPNATEGIAFARTEDGNWKADGTAFPLDGLLVDNFARLVADLPIFKVAGYGESVKWAEFGLDQPALTITLNCQAPEATHTIKIGKPAFDGGGRYVRIDDGKALLLVRDSPLEPLVRTRNDFLDRQILTFAAGSLKGLARKMGDAEFEVTQGAGEVWEASKPAKQSVDKILMEDLDSALGNLRADKIAAYGRKDQHLAKFGLDKPTATITLSVGEKDKAEKKKLLIGSPVDPTKLDGDRYGTLDAAGDDCTIAVLPTLLVKHLLAPPVGFRDHTMAAFKAADKVVGERGDRKVSFSRMGDTWKMIEPTAAEADSFELEDFIARLRQLRMEEVVAEKPMSLKPYGLEKPEAKWTISDGGKEVLTILIGDRAADGRVYAMTEKGELVGLLSPDLSGRVLDEYRVRKVWGIDAAQLQSVTITEGKKQFALLKSGQRWLDVARPEDKIDTRAVTELLSTLAGLKAERFAADKDADLKLYGLDTPSVRIVASRQAGESQTLLIGMGVGGKDRKRVYAKVDAVGRTDVFILSEADTARLLRERGAYLEKK